MEKDFFQRVYELVRQIPQGKITTYGQIAKLLGTARSARMVGWALNKSGGLVPFVPAHRVVNKQGLLTGKMHFTNANTMEEMLAAEGIKIIENQIQNMEKHLWQPAPLED